MRHEETAVTNALAVVENNNAEARLHMQLVKHETPRRQIQDVSRTGPNGTPLEELSRKDNQASRGWKEWTLGHDHEETSGLSKLADDLREKLVLKSLSKHKLKTPHIRRAVNETISSTSSSSPTSFSTTSVAVITSSSSSEIMISSTSSSDSTSTISSSILDGASSSSSSTFSSAILSSSFRSPSLATSTVSFPPTTSSSKTSSAKSDAQSQTVSPSEITRSSSDSIMSETPVSTSVWTSTLRNPDGTAVSTVTETTIIYNIFSPSSSDTASSAVVVAAPQLQTTAAINEATHRSAGQIAAKAAVGVVGMIWLL
ncbi:hypothetical protein LIPSTDRAFT_70320 [Lipomyces starkeyi NRRL Y-11557]|uniref:Uncharacterized protein n=1 Tax=Lipomyces starkeyi NRRL Y-11557 TaxID=675824 RepID=A0A1E3QCA3_LIPST|nr:hypothetical protein LIPSTDRAFT_70320 [Lipomyces starkeyi NRRL Y-11557]